MPDGQVRGNKNAPAIIDLRRDELRIPSYGIAQKLRKSLVRALIEENSLDPRPDFVLQVTRRGLVRIVAHRRLRARLELPLRIATIDENSRHGHSLAHWYINETKVAMTHFEKLRKEECDDDSVLAERVLSALREWLEEHSHALAY